MPLSLPCQTSHSSELGTWKHPSFLVQWCV